MRINYSRKKINAVDVYNPSGQLEDAIRRWLKPGKIGNVDDTHLKVWNLTCIAENHRADAVIIDEDCELKEMLKRSLAYRGIGMEYAPLSEEEKKEKGSDGKT